MLILVLLGFLDIWARIALENRDYGLVNILIIPAIIIGDIMNLIPSNPFALGLPYALML